MGKIKISSLGIFDEQKFKKLASDRQEWLNSGEDMLLTNSSSTKKLADDLYPTQLLVVVNKVFQENNNYKTILLTSVNSESLPIFKAGQKISLTLSINNKYYTKSYSLVSSPYSSNRGEYRITVRDDKNSIVDEYLYNKAKIGELVSISNPFGEFYYNSLRDKNNIIAIVSEDGIMPVYSMIQSIVEGSSNFNLTLFYSAKLEEDLLYKEDLLMYDEKSNNVSVNFVLIDEKKDNYEHGFVTIDMVEKVFKDNDTSIFISGTEGLLKYLDKELEGLKLPKKYIIYDKFLPVCNIKRAQKYVMSVYINNEKYDIPCYNNKTIMYALMDGGVYIPSKCNNGSCGFCRSELVLGEVKVINDKRSITDKKYNYIHPCCTYPLSDIEIVVR